MDKHIQYSVNCSGCGACSDICHEKAISMVFDKDGLCCPQVNENICIGCGACVRTCPCYQNLEYPPVAGAYIAKNNNDELYHLSSSGGIFSALAEAILSEGGTVYGAAIVKEEERINCRHIRTDDLNMLPLLQGSKYVRSSTAGVFAEVRDLLEEGRKVLFSGTSCQIASLRLFLGKEYDGLYTVDLVCHGVPEITSLQEYVGYLEKRRGINISSISFRNKDAMTQGRSGDNFIMTLICEDEKTREKQTLMIQRSLSSYYALFLGRANYRENCYYCKYASEKKPGDLTLGDFRPSEEETEVYGLESSCIYSSVFVRTEKGKELMRLIDSSCEKTGIEMNEIIKHHLNMRSPSRISSKGRLYLKVYSMFGYRGLDFFLKAKKRMANRRYRQKEVSA